MKAFRTILSSMLVCLSIMISAPEMKAQQTLRSQIVTEYDGKPYYIHTVQKKQSLKDIAEIYDVTVYEILKENNLNIVFEQNDPKLESDAEYIASFSLV